MLKALYIFRSPFSYARFVLKKVAGDSYLDRKWIEDHSPVLLDLKGKVKEGRPFEGLTFGVCLPGTWESFLFLSVIATGGANIWFYPMFCRPDVEVEILKERIADIIKFNDLKSHVKASDFLYDSTALLGKIATQEDTFVKGIIEQTASGIKIYSEYCREGLLRQPVLNLDTAFVKRIGENRMATGLGLLEALLKLHLFLPSKHVLVLGFGNVGQGCASFLRELGCRVSIYEIDTNKSVEAEQLGYETGRLETLLPQADIIVNATGSLTPALDSKQLMMLKSGAVLANMGGEGWDQKFLWGKPKEKIGSWMFKICLDSSKYVYEMAQGRPVNFIFASGTDLETMDMVFSLSVLAFEYLVKNYESLPKTLQSIPKEIQQRHLEVASKISARKDLINLMEEH